MKHKASLLLLLLLACPQQTFAQNGAAQSAAALNDTQQHGRQLLAQSCGVCHLPPSAGAKTYGPPLNKAAGNGDDDIMREYITNGTPRMPAFKLFLKPEDIDAIIAYVRTVPVAAAQAPTRAPAGGE